MTMSKKRYYEDREVFCYGRGIFQVHEADGKYWRKLTENPNLDCFDCCFRNNRGKGACSKLACHANERKDGKEVIFERI